ncbi:MAG: DNA cytosine methyltransferase [Deltaproteobacteria bacterium]|nr:DNA cytosine methyltransferase [Deltaproteobacteria bacterium]
MVKSTKKSHKQTVLSLFTGAGGFDLGLEAAGFHHVLCVENDIHARNTLLENRPKWRLSEPGDIHQISTLEILKQSGLQPRQLTLLAGGPPCQPFSKSGYWRNGDSLRLQDPRARTLEGYLKVAEATLPVTLVLENVKGLIYSKKNEGLEYFKNGLIRINRKYNTSYEPTIIDLNAADYGVPQIRERVFVIAHIDGQHLITPPPTHDGKDGRPGPRSAWDAIGDLDGESFSSDLIPNSKWAKLLPSIPEGRNYLWHTPRNTQKGSEPLFGWRTRYWSFLLKLSKASPSWTIQADPGPATGPFHWRNRRLSIKELCRIQTFPDGFEIAGTYHCAHRQVGNAVPSAIGELIGLEIRRQFFNERVRRKLKLIPEQRDDCPQAERRGPVPKQYLALRGNHHEHPGTGLGPAAKKRDS